MHGVHAKVLILQCVLGVAHFSTSNTVFPPEGTQAEKVFCLRELHCPLKIPKSGIKEDRGCSSKFGVQGIQGKRFSISE